MAEKGDRKSKRSQNTQNTRRMRILSSGIEDVRLKAPSVMNVKKVSQY